MPETTSGLDYSLPQFSALQDFHPQHTRSCQQSQVGRTELTSTGDRAGAGAALPLHPPGTKSTKQQLPRSRGDLPH